jgi:hypothetical protein
MVQPLPALSPAAVARQARRKALEAQARAVKAAAAGPACYCCGFKASLVPAGAVCCGVVRF